MTDEPGGVQTASSLLAFERLSDTRFRALYNQDNYTGAIFGGQALCQSVAAAQLAAPDWPIHACAGAFLRAGDVAQPIEFEIERVRDGRRFAARRVVARQGGRAIFDMLCSFHDPETGFTHQRAEPPKNPPDPESLPNLQDFAKAHADRLPARMAALYMRPFPVELRLFEPERVFFEPLNSARRDYWLRMPSAAGIARPRDHAALLAFMSDYWLVGCVGAAHVTPAAKHGYAMASLNHSLWFHAPARADQWLLFQTESPWAAEGRGLARGFVYDQAGKLLASMTQEVSVRPRA